MKHLKFLVLFFTASLILASCSKDDDGGDPINEEEVITTLRVTLVGGGSTIELEYRDLDPDGPTLPTITGGTLMANTTYTASMTLLNELENPVDDITEEIEEEADEHQFFYQVEAGLNISNLTYDDFDSNGKPLGLKFSFQTGEESEGDLTIRLRHKPNKDAEGVSEGDITNAGGETDISVSFPITIIEEKVITTLSVSLTGGSSPVTMTYRDLDPDGPTAPTITVSGSLDANTLYTGSIILLNELENPVEDITIEIIQEADEHQFFYQVGAGLNISNLVYLDFDGNGKPLGLNFRFNTGDASQGNFTIILRHEPNKDAPGVSEGDITNAGGETDISTTFPVVIE